MPQFCDTFNSSSFNFGKYLDSYPETRRLPVLLLSKNRKKYQNIKSEGKPNLWCCSFLRIAGMYTPPSLPGAEKDTRPI